MSIELLDELVTFDEDYSDSFAGTRLLINRSQEIPDEHVSALKRDKIDSLHTPTGDFYRVASIPISVIQQWDREGFRIEEASAAEIVRRLNNQHLDAFITTRKSI